MFVRYYTFPANDNHRSVWWKQMAYENTMAHYEFRVDVKEIIDK